MLDEKSYQIIELLSKNGRYSYSKIAKELNLSTAVVSSTVMRMLDEGIITIQAVPNPYRLGLRIQVLIFLNMASNVTQRITDAIRDNRYISSIVTLFGKFSMLIQAEFPDIDELYGLVQDTLSTIDGINRIETYFISSRMKGYDRLFTPERKQYTQLEPLERDLIEELRRDGRVSFKTLAEKYGVSSATITRKVDHLIQDKYIRIVAIPNHTKLLNSTAVAYLLLSVTPSKITAVQEKLSTYPSVHTVLTMINRYNILCVIVQPSRTSLEYFISNTIMQLDGIYDTELMYRADLKKRTYVYVDDEEVLRYEPQGLGAV